MGGDADSTYRMRDSVTWREVDGEVVALHLDDSVYFAITGVGTLVWPLLSAGASRRRLLDEVMTAHPDVGDEQAGSDLDDFLTSCMADNLIEEIPS
jgi:Coenzyme PQQ synthesis protein D (PqqD)